MSTRPSGFFCPSPFSSPARLRLHSGYLNDEEKVDYVVPDAENMIVDKPSQEPATEYDAAESDHGLEILVVEDNHDLRSFIKGGTER